MDDFIIWLLNHYNVSDFALENYAKRYKNGLIDNIDFKQMRKYIENNCDCMPNSTEINKIAKSNGMFISKSKILRHIEKIKNTPKIDFAAISQEFRQKLLDFHKKYGIKTKIKELQNAGEV